LFQFQALNCGGLGRTQKERVMKKRRIWQSKLTKTELRHLKKDAFRSGVRITLAGLEDMFEHQSKMRTGVDGCEPCWMCRTITGKLGFKV
jgi:hypothetical protein